MKALIDHLGLTFRGEIWILDILVVVSVVVALNLLAGHLLRRAERLAAATTTVWDEALISAARLPLQTLFWLLGLAYAANLTRADMGLPDLDMVKPLREVGVVLCLAWFLFRLIRNVAASVVQLQEARGETVDHTTVDAISKLARIVVLALAGLVILQTLGFSLAGVLTFGGIGGIAVGFAAKDLLANFFGGLTIYLDRPFAVGEWIRSPDKAIEGTVEYIGWRHTRLRAFNKNPIYVPNALFSTIVVENPSRMTHRRIQETIGLRYQDLGKMAAIVEEVRALLRAHPDIDQGQNLIVNFDTFGESSLNFILLAFTPVTDRARFHELKQGILLGVAEIITRHGAEIAFPTRTLHMAEPDRTTSS
jgi:MscS family membrane protein